MFDPPHFNSWLRHCSHTGDVTHLAMWDYVFTSHGDETSARLVVCSLLRLSFSSRNRLSNYVSTLHADRSSSAQPSLAIRKIDPQEYVPYITHAPRTILYIILVRTSSSGVFHGLNQHVVRARIAWCPYAPASCICTYMRASNLYENP
jgi:hypothetical protein